jgi:hypothetical protein
LGWGLKGESQSVFGPQGRGRPPLLNSCHAFAETGRVVHDLYPDHYTGPAIAPASDTTLQETPCEPSAN